MGIPISYNIRNLVVRKTTTLFTVVGVALTVAVLVSVLGLVTGLRHSFAVTGNPMHLLLMRKSSTSELISSVSREDFQVIKVKPGIARNAAGEPMASLEMVTVINLDNGETAGGMNVNLRGLQPIGFEMRDVKMASGRMFRPGHREAVVGMAIANKYPAARVGGKLEFGRGIWDVVGVMDGGVSAYNSEVFVDSNIISTDYQRTAVLSSVLLRVEPGMAEAVRQSVIDDRRLNVDAEFEREYYAEQTNAALPIQFMGGAVAIIMAAGSVLSAMNTMFSAVARRGPEIGTLRILGFSRVQILSSFLIESVILSGIGGVIGVLAVLPLRNWSTSVGSFKTFAEVSFQFRMGPEVMLAGVVFAIGIGAVGGMIPATLAARKEILEALGSRTA